MLADRPARPGAAHATDRFGFLFLELIVLFLLAAFTQQSALVRLTVGLLVIAIVLTSLRASGTQPRLLRLAAFGGIAMAVLVVIGTFSSERRIQGVVSIAVGLVLAIATVAILRRILEHDYITLRQVVAALAAYVQLALTFALIYSGVAALSTQPFFAEGDLVIPGSYLYFSVVTVSTLGYGDLTPVTGVGRTLAMIETLFGQILLVVLVAYLVGSLGGRHRPMSDADADATPSD
jgi:hypothetical protein